MFKFSLYGDTVNVASRMESTGKAGCIHISEATYALLEGAARACFEPTDGVQVKGKGHMASYIYCPGEPELKLTPADFAMIAQLLASTRSLPAWGAGGGGGSGGGGSGGRTPGAAARSANKVIFRSASQQPMWMASSGDGDAGAGGGGAAGAAGAAGDGVSGSAAAGSAAAGAASFAADGKPPRRGHAALTLPVGEGKAGCAGSSSKRAVPSPQQQEGTPPRSPMPRTAHFSDELTFVGGGSGSGGSGGAVAASTSAHALAGAASCNAVGSSNDGSSSQFMSRAASGASARATVVIPKDTEGGLDARGAARRSGRGGVGDTPSVRQSAGDRALGQPSGLTEIRQITSSVREAYGAGAGGRQPGAPLRRTYTHIPAGCLPPPSHAGTDAVGARLATLCASAGRRTPSATGSTGSHVDDGVDDGSSSTRSPVAGGAHGGSMPALKSSVMRQVVEQRHESPRKLGREPGALGALLRSSMPRAMRAGAVGAGVHGGGGAHGYPGHTRSSTDPTHIAAAGAHGGGGAHSVSAILLHGSSEHAPQAGGGLQQAAAAGAVNPEAGPQPSKDVWVSASAGSSDSSGSKALPEARAGPRRSMEGESVAMAMHTDFEGTTALMETARTGFAACQPAQWNSPKRSSAPLLLLLRCAVDPRPSDAQQAEISMAMEALSQGPRSTQLLDDTKQDDTRDESIRLLLGLGARGYDSNNPVVSRIVRELALLARVPRLINEAVVPLTIARQKP
ncbi:hypothetical protein FOA52_003056 [Chlamydomonas sp. UWO 241]|nr:hypothetical protein FOA52_003056 [Chlamydomonas sp. UWO 241]